jgi:hypothetical protein
VQENLNALPAKVERNASTVTEATSLEWSFAQHMGKLVTNAMARTTTSLFAKPARLNHSEAEAVEVEEVTVDEEDPAEARATQAMHLL